MHLHCSRRIAIQPESPDEKKYLHLLPVFHGRECQKSLVLVLLGHGAQ